ncbi:glycosyltransferase family 4 protein [Arenimonas fontis]|uniref:Glycosyltransferase family 4 protein n=1 Tax=Arenimonas fontis TaxID=2608255 RepID=A0A5B2ZAG4_9GAMM|nr:glycosyltransferase family 4 protein [Arenimonas fontis]KAA2284925.1 glycosyltransferase family 4 protein [Arenimonas fontis]
MTEPSRVLHIAGTGLRGSGYPNATRTIAILREHLGVEVRDRARWLPEGTVLWRQASGKASALAFLLKLGTLNALEALRALVRAGTRSRIYAPYPAIFLLWWLSWVPRRLRPKVMADAYVSLWDSAFRDRRVGRESGLLSRLVRRFEGRALRAAHCVLVDTVANRELYIAEFGIAPSRIRAIPLAIDPVEVPARSNGTDTDTGALKVLFIGTLVPLHGIRVVADAIRRLAGARDRFEFTIVGDGQDAEALEQLKAEGGGQFTWVRGWQSIDGVLRHIATADLCLGVFGGEGKAARVLPFKVYLALAAGRAVVTQDSYSLPEGIPDPPVHGVAPEGAALARALEELAGDRAKLRALSAQALAYYRDYLSADRIACSWRSLLEG